MSTDDDTLISKSKRDELQTLLKSGIEAIDFIIRMPENENMKEDSDWKRYEQICKTILIHCNRLKDILLTYAGKQKEMFPSIPDNKEHRFVKIKSLLEQFSVYLEDDDNRFDNKAYKQSKNARKGIENLIRNSRYNNPSSFADNAELKQLLAKAINASFQLASPSSDIPSSVHNRMSHKMTKNLKSRCNNLIVTNKSLYPEFRAIQKTTGDKGFMLIHDVLQAVLQTLDRKHRKQLVHYSRSNRFTKFQCALKGWVDRYEDLTKTTS
eukprot:Nk52_evm15s356 gene=Nk52_evmTU15s356